jgi:hypothetical protein
LRATPQAERQGSVLQLRALRAETPRELFTLGSHLSLDPESLEYRVTATPGHAPFWIGWQIPEASGAALQLHWVGITRGEAAGIAVLD